MPETKLTPSDWLVVVVVLAPVALALWLCDLARRTTYGEGER